MSAAHRLATAGLMLLGLALVGGGIKLIFEIVTGTTAAIIATSLPALAFVLFWLVIPIARRTHNGTDV